MADLNLTSVYQYYDRFGMLLYVGLTSTGVRRNQEHNREQRWWKFVESQSVEHLPSREAAIGRERALILDRRPPFNTIHNPSHTDLESAYVAFHATGAADLSAVDVWKNIKRLLPLAVSSHGVSTNGRLTLRSSLQHAPLVLQLDVKKNTPVLVGGQRSGEIISVTRCGPCLSLALEHLKSCERFAEATATIRMVTGKAKTIYRVKHITLKMVA